MSNFYNSVIAVSDFIRLKKRKKQIADRRVGMFSIARKFLALVTAQILFYTTGDLSRMQLPIGYSSTAIVELVFYNRSCIAICKIFSATSRPCYFDSILLNCSARSGHYYSLRGSITSEYTRGHSRARSSSDELIIASPFSLSLSLSLYCAPFHRLRR